MSSAEIPHTLNLKDNLTRQLRYQTDAMVGDFISKHMNDFDADMIAAKQGLKRKINKEVVKDSDELRKNVLNMLERTCSIILSMYGKSPNEIDSEVYNRISNLNVSTRNRLEKISKDQVLFDNLTEEDKETLDYEALLAIKDMNIYSDFIKKHGWNEHAGAGIRHKITRDELAYELCEVIRKVYYVYMEDQIPEKYRTEIIETYLMKEEDVTKS
jgi:hypothetical protein